MIGIPTSARNPSLAVLVCPMAFVSRPWVQLYVATDGAAAPCCEYYGRIGSVQESTLAEIWSGGDIAETRSRFLAGEHLAECWKCQDRESNNLSSLRGLFNSQFSDHVAAVADAKQQNAPVAAMPVAFDIRFTNLCNFRCRTCWHGLLLHADGTARSRLVRAAHE